MIDRQHESEKPTFETVLQPERRGRRWFFRSVAALALLAIGAGVTLVWLERLPNPAQGLPSTAQQLLDILNPPAPEADVIQVASAAMIKNLPPQDRLANAPVIAAAPQADISQPGLEQLVTRSIGSLGSAPLGLAPAAPQAEQPVVEAAVAAAIAAPAVAPAPAVVQPVAVTPAPIDPTTLFTGANAANNNSCVEDLRGLARDTHVYFPSGGLAVDEQGMVQARLIAFIAQSCPGVVIQVEGHSDPSGNSVSNMRLSEERAQTVMARLGASGVDISNFRAVGFGDRQPSPIRGANSASYYDRRVEFSVVQTSSPQQLASGSFGGARAVPACVTQLQEATARTRLFFEPGSIVAQQRDLSSVYQLAAAASACPEARLRVVGQFSDDPGSGETPATARVRAIALMSGLVASGFAADQIIIGAPSRPTVLPNAPGVSERRIDFDVIYEDI